MKKLILLILIISSCNSSIKYDNKVTHDNNLINEYFRNFQVFDYYKNGTIKYYKFKKISGDGLLLWIKYNNDTIVSTMYKNNELVIAREQFDNGNIIFYTVAPPLLIMETILSFKYNNNTKFKDTIYGNEIHINMKEVKEVNIEVAAIDTNINKYILENFTYSIDSFFNTGLMYK